MNDLISVIVPVYNVEKYLRRCVKSILVQSHQNLEIILVDDGSTDESGIICDEFANKDIRVKVVHKTNGGLSDARNAGIAAATGYYIVFCDSDDWMEQTILQEALLASQKKNADIVVWGYSADFVDPDEELLSQQDHVPENITFIRGQDNKKLSSELLMGLIGYAWNKLYKRDIIKGFLFEKGISLVEDILFNKSAFTSAETITFLGRVGTHYIQRNRETLGTKFYPDYFELKYRASQARETILASYLFNGKALVDAMSSTYFGVLESVIRMTSRTNHFFSNNERKQYLRSVFDTEEAKTILKNYRPQGAKKTIMYLLMQARAFSVLVWIFQKY